MSMGFPTGFLHRKMVLFSGYFGVLLSYLWQALFWVFDRIFMRYFSPEAIKSARSATISHDSNFSGPKSEAGAGYSNSSKDEVLNSESFEEGTDSLPEESDSVDSNNSQPEPEPKIECSEIMDDTESVCIEEADSPKLVFKFQYQNWKLFEEFDERNDESSRFVNNRDMSSSKYEFISGNSASHYLEEPEASILTVKELFVQSNDGSLKNNATKNFRFFSEIEGGDVLENKAEKLKAMPCVEATEQPESRKNQMKNPYISTSNVFPSLGHESNPKSSNINSLLGSQLSDSDMGTTVELDKSRNQDNENAGLTEEDMDLDGDRWSDNLDVGYEPDDFDEEDKDLMEELQKFEEEAQAQKLSGNNDSCKAEESGGKEKRLIDCPEDSAKPNLQSSIGSDLEDSNRFDILWEHQDLMEQLKMELKKVKATGLPTILEDSEFPRMMEDLKPWKIEDKFQPGTSTTNEVPKFSRSYRERMRKFDILNYQKMWAIVFLQSKEPLQSFSSHKTSSTRIMSQLSQSFHRSRPKKSESDPAKKFIRELYSDLETIYVGQLSLSWEFLQWQYEKALEIWESDQYGTRRFNEVAGEFQQFQVLLQRFIENEPFQEGPRVENYVRNRYAMKNLLQVPVIREDNAKDKKKIRKRDSDDDAITSGMLVEILEESIRTIWRFIRADKDACNLALRGAKENQTELQDPADAELLAQVRAELQKKEKRLREILRGGSCILKKLQKQKEEETDQYLYFFSQVDMKLVWRVVNMSRITTDQLAWCRNKLTKINFVNRTLHVQPTFLLFPT
ncbi:uncharacterized protein LOC114736826 isoform X2 [Neltuma alba]|uniref:uncharacterized protein LOC114736826 isoform X1 n=1 Tax=Neltuma alba TaxID=207710 RepID=UPI0010A59D45|nr:uncharacterized protein LOC114736826 isoform X1 [Prosopis alba]XP_028780542.1 uncharacterized protein LOC114736826 isoform X2 [Prosopis alba]